MVVTIHQAKTNLSKLLAEVEAGGEVIIARGKTPIAKLSPITPEQPRRVYGAWKDLPGFGIDEAFFEPLPDDELALWNGEGD